MSTKEIATMFNVTDGAIIFWLHKHNIPRRSTSQARAIKHWGLTGSKNPMWNKCGELSPQWKGGVTPDRQSFYLTEEWKKVCSLVWKRDKSTCQKCNLHRGNLSRNSFHVHHIVPFDNTHLRATESNLVLLCIKCHRFVHSKRNINNEFIQKG
jgi:hypothetical protein